MGTGSTPSRTESSPAAGLHRLRSAASRLKLEIELADLDAKPPGALVEAAMDSLMARLADAEQQILGRE